MTPPPPSGPPRVSVLLPVYNGAATLERAVASILGQTWGDFELILHDDGSTDGSAAQIAELLRRDPRLRSSRSEENRGLGAAMAQLASLARGEYLAIQEQDDVSAPDRLAAEVAALDADPEAGLVSGIAEWLDEKGEPFRLFPGLLAGGGQYPQEPAAMVRYLFLEQCKVVNAGAMFRRRVLGPTDPGSVPVFFDPAARMSVDWQFFLRLAHSWRILGLHRVVVRMQRGAGRDSLTRRKELQFAEARRCLRLLYDELALSPASPIDRSLYRQAQATQLLLEGRFYGGRRGLGRLLAALLREPGRAEIWRSLAELAGGGFRRLRAEAAPV
jgi:glycosyltransferase involved in cell wall biosynthesis